MPAPEPGLPDWPRAWGAPLARGVIRQQSADFEVTEALGFEPSGDGEHDFLWVEKCDANTAWVASQLARHARIPAGDVGYAGLKDRHAVTRQWFSIRRPTLAGTDWSTVDIPGVRVLDIDRNRRKLRRGAHAGNVFRIVVRGVDCAAAQIDDRLGLIRAGGVPNYFGPQRFGRGGGNIALARSLFSGRRLRRDRRAIALSAARSYLFNEVLSRRVADGSWNQVLPDDLVSIDGSGSFFAVPTVTEDVRARVGRLALHPTGPMWGRGSGDGGEACSPTERQVATQHADLADGLEAAGVDCARRALRTVPQSVRWRHGDGTLTLSFRLERGAYATSLLREIVAIEQG